jgi:hypothetical protein
MVPSLLLNKAYGLIPNILYTICLKNNSNCIFNKVPIKVVAGYIKTLIFECFTFNRQTSAESASSHIDGVTKSTELCRIPAEGKS